MNTPHDDGGPAFPMHGQPEDRFAGYLGMSLRDWLSGMALPSIYTAGVSELSEHEIAVDCYRMADAMIAARKEAR